jgi:hypothetical protein
MQNKKLLLGLKRIAQSQSSDSLLEQQLLLVREWDMLVQ